MYNPANGHMCFAEALAYIKRGLPVGRAPWKGHACVWNFGQSGELRGQLSLVIQTPTSYFFSPWNPSSSDVLAEDWVAVIPADTPDLNRSEPKGNHP